MGGNVHMNANPNMQMNVGMPGMNVHANGMHVQANGMGMHTGA